MIFFNADSPEWGVLSNLADLPTWVKVDREKVVFRNVEAASQFLKRRKWLLHEALEWSSKDGKEALVEGRTVELREDWEECRRKWMKELVRRKVEMNAEQITPVLCVKKPLVYWGPWEDRYWGVGKDGEGENELGKILMELRPDFCASQRKDS